MPTMCCVSGLTNVLSFSLCEMLQGWFCRKVMMCWGLHSGKWQLGTDIKVCVILELPGSCPRGCSISRYGKIYHQTQPLVRVTGEAVTDDSGTTG